MQQPAYFERRPHLPLDSATIESFERLYDEAVEHGSGAEIAYSLAAPKWQFLCYLTDTKNVLAHGSGDPNIDMFEPRQSNDVSDFGNRQAVYAASDALWAMYFAIVDRERGVTSLVNACFRVMADDGSTSEPYYFFSINEDALALNAWRDGTLYLLPRATFEQQPPWPKRGTNLEMQQWASLVPVKPLAKMAVTPADFPFLSKVRGHNVRRVQERAERDLDGFPWLDE